MTWNYSGDPADSTKDEVRFLVGDTCVTNQLVQDEEIDYALGKFSTPTLAAALVLRTLAAKFSRLVTGSVGEVSSNCSDMAKAYSKRADELDPGGITTSDGLIVLPKFGGISISEKEALDADSDAVQPAFRKGMNDIPGGPSDSVTSDSSDNELTNNA
jgi:hypothetical protein